MHCHGVLPIYHSNYDINVDTGGVPRPMYNGNGHHNNHELTLLVSQASFGHMELVRETMLVHEATFRNQVQDLHRLYRRQRELMTEIKTRELFVNQLHFEVQSSNSSSAILLSAGQDNHLYSLPFFSSQGRANYVNTDLVQRAFSCIKVTTPEIPVVSQNDSPVSKYQLSKGKRIGGKLLDLELPAEAYIDSDEWEWLGNGSCSIDLNSAIFGTIASEKQNGMSSFDSMDCGSMKKPKRCRLIDINLPCDPTTDDDAFTEDIQAGQIDLNISIIHDELPTKLSSLDNSSVEINLEAPASPEVEEGAPPRGDALGERAQIAAKAIVSMSEIKVEQICENSDSGVLEWFAEIVTEIDVFEVMTLNLTEVKQEECIYRNSVKNSNQTSSVLLTGKTRKGRLIRSKRKDFQKEILPALTSLSRVEVTEDLQILEGLMVDAGTPWQFRAKRASRMGRKSRGIKKPTVSSTITPEVKDEFIMSWGRKNRRLRGQRTSATPAVIISRWLEFSA